MIQTPIKVLFVYSDNNPWITTNHYNSTYRNFYMKALKRNKNIDVTYQTNSIKNHEAHDVLLLLGINYELKDVKIPIITEMGDPQSTPIHKQDKYITCFYSGVPTEYAYQYHSKESYKHKTLLYGIEPSIYQYTSSNQYKSRIHNKILNTGAADYPCLRNIVKRIVRRQRMALMDRHYKLRSKCNYLKYVDYKDALKHKYVGDRYPELLQKYRASIAATTEFPTRKYFEIPAAGCLTFMEITKKNRGNHIGFTDGINAVFINEYNYKDKFEEYLSDIDNPKWEKIANAGREHAMNNFSNDVAVEKLIDIMREEMQ